MHLILFDIDGTLIDSGEAGTRSMDLAFRELFDVENSFHGIGMAGKTDTQIMKEGLTKHGISANGNLDALMDVYLKHLQKEINNDRKHIKPGIHKLLEDLSLMKNMKIGLLTGNIEAGARIKLKSFDLNKYFQSGAFGSDDEDRDKLLPVAKNRFEELYGSKINFKDCVVIGDTPRDVHCSKPYGAVSVGVATGPYTIAALKQAGADFVFENLSEHSRLLQVLG